MSKVHEGCLLIADISGYTQYLSESELEHAQDTLTALLYLLVENTRPPLIISRLAGDAVISYGLREGLYQGQTLVEKIEDTYVSFKKAIERLVLNNTCRCNACANISNLDLKFFIHYGTFGVQRISDHEELVGSDINLLHRLLKNNVIERTGIDAYALYTDKAIQELAIEDLRAGMIAHTESYDHLGQVAVWVQDMAPVWERKKDSLKISLQEDEAWLENSIDIPLPREQVWDYLIQPDFRNIFIRADVIKIANRTAGRVGPGSVYQCYHGDKMVPQTILEWEPFERMLVKELFPFSMAVSYLAEYILEDSERGTRFRRVIARPEGPLPGRLALRLMSLFFNRMTDPLIKTFAEEIEADASRQTEAQKEGEGFSWEQIEREARASLKGLAKHG